MSAELEKEREVSKSSHGGARPGSGRPKGVPNKINGELKDMILTALHEVGGVDYLKFQANENAKTFLLLLGRVLPLQVSGDPDNPVKLEIGWARSQSEGTADPSKKS